MAQTTQIVPKFSFPYVETVVNDYTAVPQDTVTDSVDTTVRQVYAVTAPKGVDNVWVYKTTASSAIKTFGSSNFKKYGQPYMQSLNVLDQNDSSAYIMRVMPENATFANSIVTVGYKADTEAEVSDAHLRKFRIKLHGNSVENVTNDAALKAEYNKSKGVDTESFNQINLMAVRTAGRGSYGETYSVRISQPSAYEKQFGIKMYDFEIITSESGLVKDADYIASIVSSGKYINRVSTFINDVLFDTEVGLAPVDIYVSEENVEEIYNAYIEFAKKLHDDCVTEYEQKLVSYAIPDDIMNGTTEVTPEYAEQYAELKEIELIIEETSEENLPELDQFDPIYGRTVGSSVMYPGIKYIQPLTDSIDTEAEGYDPKDYTTDTDIVDFESVKGLTLVGGTNGYFDNPRTTTDTDGQTIQWTYDDEVEECYKNAFSGKYDTAILSKKRMPITVFFDANYPFSVKEIIATRVIEREYARFFMDCGIIESLSLSQCRTLANKYAEFDDNLISADIHNYLTSERGTYKKVRVTISYYMSALYIRHYMDNGFYVPFVKANCRLSGHVRNSLKPVIEDFDDELKEFLVTNRFNYFECYEENVFQRGVQNTRQTSETDLLEENDSQILCELRKEVEKDLDSQLYNFADNYVRQSFVNVEKAKYVNWNSRIVSSINFSFKVSEWEFNHSVLHLYVEVVFRGLTKRAVLEIDLNQRTYTENATELNADSTGVNAVSVL